MELKYGKGWIKTGYVDRSIQAQESSMTNNEILTSYTSSFFLKWHDKNERKTLSSFGPMHLRDGDLVSVFGHLRKIDGCYNYTTNEMQLYNDPVSIATLIGTIPISLFFLVLGFGMTGSRDYIIGWLLLIGLTLGWGSFFYSKIVGYKSNKKAKLYIASFQNTLNKLGDTKDNLDTKELEKALLDGLNNK